MTLQTEQIGSVPRPAELTGAAADFGAGRISPEQLGTCDDCGFSPFADDASISRDLAFAKIAARAEGTALAADQLGV